MKYVRIYLVNSENISRIFDGDKIEVTTFLVIGPVWICMADEVLAQHLPAG